MNSQELFRQIQRGKLLPLYYFWGPEKWLVEEALKKIEEKALDPISREFNREVLDGGEEEAETIVASLQVFPVRSPSRMVIIRNADGIWKKPPSPFIDYFRNPNPKTCAVFIGEKTDQRTLFFRALEDKGAIVAFFPPYEKELHRWLHSRAEQLGHPLSEEAGSLLLERTGPSLQDIQTELQKIILGKEPGRRIEVEDVLTLTQDTRSESLFDFPRAVGRQNFTESLRLVRKSLQQGEPPVLLFSLLVRQLRLIRRAKDLLARGYPKKEVESRLRILPRSAADFWEQADRFPPSALEKIWGLTLKADRRLKVSRSDKSLLLEEYILDLLRNSEEARRR